jgi:hypothetical protein
LEVILALAVLAGALAMLGEAVRLGMSNAQTSRDLIQAQLLCESKLAEIAAGLTLPDPVQGARFDCVVGDGQIGWLYSISQETVGEEGVLAVCVTVTQDLPLEKRPVQFSLYRWIPDPVAVAAMEEAKAQAEAEAEAAAAESSTGGTGE